MYTANNFGNQRRVSKNPLSNGSGKLHSTQDLYLFLNKDFSQKKRSTGGRLTKKYIPTGVNI